MRAVQNMIRPPVCTDKLRERNLAFVLRRSVSLEAFFLLLLPCIRKPFNLAAFFCRGQSLRTLDCARAPNLPILLIAPNTGAETVADNAAVFSFSRADVCHGCTASKQKSVNKSVNKNIQK